METIETAFYESEFCMSNLSHFMFTHKKIFKIIMFEISTKGVITLEIEEYEKGSSKKFWSYLDEKGVEYD